MPTRVSGVSPPRQEDGYAGLPCASCPGRSTNFCRPLEERLQAEFFQTATRQRWAPKEFLFRSGDAAGPLFKITAGMALVSRSLSDGRRQILRFLLPGDVCGYLEENGCYSFDGQAISEVVTCTFPRQDFQFFERRNRAFAEAVRAELSGVLTEVSQHVLTVGYLTAVERVASFLVGIGKLIQSRGVEPLTLPMSRTDIADYLGMRIETVSRAFTAVQRQELIAVSGERVSITNLAGLTELAAQHLDR